MFKYLNYKQLNNIKFGANLASSDVISALTKEISKTFKLNAIEKSIYNDLLYINSLAVYNRYGTSPTKLLATFQMDMQFNKFVNIPMPQIVMFADTFISIIDTYITSLDNLSHNQKQTLYWLNSYLRKNRKLLKSKECKYFDNFKFIYDDYNHIYDNSEQNLLSQLNKHIL